MRTDRRIRGGVILAVAALALALSACGIPTGGAPSLIDSSSVPSPLSVVTHYPAAPKHCKKSDDVIDVWFFQSLQYPSNSSYLVPAPRCVTPAKGKPQARALAEVKTALANLLRGPTGSEHRENLWSALENVPQSSITSAEINGSELILQVDGSWQALSYLTGATAQVVSTVTSIDSKLVVRFLTQCAYSVTGATCFPDGIGPLLIYDPAGNAIHGAASRSDYASLYSPSS
jgi:hypothetical protein